MNCWKSMVLATTLLAVAGGGQSLNANDDDKGRGKNNDVPATNGAPLNQVFERQPRTGNFNDRIVVVAPEPVLP